MDALPSRFINEIPEESVENEIDLNDSEDFEFNQDNSIEFMENIEVLDGIGTKNKMLKWKIEKLKKIFKERKLMDILFLKMMNFLVNMLQNITID